MVCLNNNIKKLSSVVASGEFQQGKQEEKKVFEGDSSDGFQK